MSELWVPIPDKQPDPRNVYDLMTVFQEQLEQHASLKDAHSDALHAVRSLATAIARMPRAKKDISLSTHAAVIDSVESHSSRILVDLHVGIDGVLTDVRAEPLSLKGAPKYHLSLELDIFTMYPIANPKNCDQLLRPGSVPISMVDFIKTAA